MVSDNPGRDDKSDSDKVSKESKYQSDAIEWRDRDEYGRDRDEYARSNEVDDADFDKSGFHPPCEHCGSTVFKQEVTTTNYVECDAEGNFVDQETKHERDEIIYCDECGRKLSERTKY